MYGSKNMRVILSLVTALFLAIQINPIIGLSALANEDIINRADMNEKSEYNDYLLRNADKNFAKSEVVLNTENSDVQSNRTEQDGRFCNKLDKSNGTVTYEFDLPESGLYNISVTYYDLLNGESSVRLGFYFDGSAPYAELKNVSFSKIYTNEFDKIEKDEFGNEIRPTQIPKQRFNTEFAKSETGVYRLPYAVYLSEGKHTLTVKRVLGGILIPEVVLKAYEEPVAYDEYLSEYSDLSVNGTDKYRIEAENSFEVSASTLGATIDSTNAGMSPSSSTLRVVNSFGQNYWKSNGQWGSWIVPENFEEGLYKISFRAKQNGSVGITSYRTLYVNGTIPFREAENIGFEYNSKWQIKTFGDDNAYFVYLKPGDVITLEATVGEMSDSINKIYTVMDQLNEIYQSIIIVTGTNPDNERDYNIVNEIPTLLDDFKNVSSEINEIAGEIEAVMSKANSKVYSLRRFVTELNSYVDNYRIIVSKLDDFKDYIDSFAALTYDFNSIPLELDWIELSKNDAKESKANVSTMKALTFEIERFLYTFASEYNGEYSRKSKKAEEITVWCGLGRDQSQSVKSIIENDFIPQTGMAVNFKMTMTSLSEAILAGREPDVALSVAQDVPVDLALRGQALDLTPYLSNLSDEYMSQFNKSAWIPFQYNGGTYAVPITQDYYMMFYREDILSKLGIELPQTWSELYQVIRELQKNKFKVGIKESDSASAGISVSINVFDMFLYQNGGSYFNSDLTSTTFETPEGKEAFKSWVSLYRDYCLDKDFNLLTRFRSGEMPIILSGISFYNTVASTAQEISGRWGMTLIPGTPKDDGSIDRTEASIVTGTMILKGAQKRGVADKAFEFVKWWAGNDTQLKYINAMESIQGIAGRVPTANLVTFENLSWTDDEKTVLKKQREWVTAINQVPGIYIINRSLTNALRTSYASTSVDALRQLNIQNDIINDELIRKRAEFQENN